MKIPHKNKFKQIWKFFHRHLESAEYAVLYTYMYMYTEQKYKRPM